MKLSSTGQVVSEKNIIGIKFDIDIKWVKVNLRSSFEQTMLHSKAQGHQPSGFETEFLPYIDQTTILIMWPGPFEQTSVPTSKAYEIWVQLALWSQEVMMFENVDRWMMPHPLPSHPLPIGSAEFQ